MSLPCLPVPPCAFLYLPVSSCVSQYLTVSHHIRQCVSMCLPSISLYFPSLPLPISPSLVPCVAESPFTSCLTVSPCASTYLPLYLNASQCLLHISLHIPVCPFIAPVSPHVSPMSPKCLSRSHSVSIDRPVSSCVCWSWCLCVRMSLWGQVVPGPRWRWSRRRVEMS